MYKKLNRTQVRIKWEDKMIEELKSVIAPQLQETCDLLKGKLLELGCKEGADSLFPIKDIPIRTGPAMYFKNHEPISRIGLDMNSVREIRGYGKRFAKKIRGAISELYASADAQGMPSEKFARQMERIEADLKQHRDEFKEYLEKMQKELKDAKSYKELLGTADMIRNGLQAFVRNLDNHLVAIGPENEVKRI